MANFNYETLTEEDRRIIHDDLTATAIRHITAAPGLFEPMPFNPQVSESQRLEKVHLDPTETSFDEIDTLGRIAGGAFYDFVQAKTGKLTSFFDVMRSEMEDGENIFPVTPHGNIADIAFWQTGWVKNIGQDDWQERNADAISRGVTAIKALDMAASEVVQKLGHVFLSFPRTPTTEQLAKRMKKEAAIGNRPVVDIDSLIDTNNVRMVREARAWLDTDTAHEIGRKAVSKTFHLAWSGKTDKVRWGDNHKPESIELGEVSKGTIKLVKNGLVLPIAIWYGEEPVLEVGELTKVSNAEDVIRVQKWQAKTLAEQLNLPESVVTLETLAA